MAINPSTRFADLVERETHAYNAHVNTIARLQALKRALSTAEKAELARSQAVLKEIKRSGKKGRQADEVCDPLFVATRTLLNEEGLIAPELASHKDGALVFAGAPNPAAQLAAVAPAQAQGAPPPDPPIVLTTVTLGLLIADGVDAPPVRLVPQRGDQTGAIDPDRPGQLKNVTLYPDLDHPGAARFTRDFYRALGEARGYGSLADKVLALLAREGDPDGPHGAPATVRCEEFAKVMRRLFDAKVATDEPQLRRRVNQMLDKVQNVGSENRIADLSIDLPNLEDIYDESIVEDNVRVMGPMIVSAMFDELKVFQVVDRIVEQFQHGVLPIGPGKAGAMLYDYWREAPNRMSEQERRNFAAITLGIPGGDPGGQVNRDFNDLWIRFVSSVSSFVRQGEVDALLRSSTPSAVSHQQVRKAARDLAANLSLHGYGMAHYAAREIRAQVDFMIALLSDQEIRGCFGARDMWQVVDQVATFDLGGAKTSTRYVTLASCGSIITAWLADNVMRINRTTGPLIDIDVVRNPPVTSSHKATLHPNDYDLVNACELWLADTATSDREIERLAQEPRDTPTMTSKPIRLPAMAREMLEGLDDLGVGLGHGAADARPPFVGSNGYGRAL